MPDGSIDQNETDSAAPAASSSSETKNKGTEKDETEKPTAAATQLLHREDEAAHKGEKIPDYGMPVWAVRRPV